MLAAVLLSYVVCFPCSGVPERSDYPIRFGFFFQSLNPVDFRFFGWLAFCTPKPSPVKLTKLALEGQRHGVAYCRSAGGGRVELTDIVHVCPHPQTNHSSHLPSQDRFWA